MLGYLRGHEGRGIGLGAKFEAYALQDEGKIRSRRTRIWVILWTRATMKRVPLFLRDLGVSQISVADEQSGRAGWRNWASRSSGHPGRDGAERGATKGTSSRSRSMGISRLTRSPPPRLLVVKPFVTCGSHTRLRQPRSREAWLIKFDYSGLRWWG